MPVLQKPFVIDTNILLDCFVFDDANTTELKRLMIMRQLNWVATPSMEEEFLRVLGYPLVSRWIQKNGVSVNLAEVFSLYAWQTNEAPHVKTCLCQDQDDQKFINLAMAQKAVLLSKDKAILKMTSRLKTYSVTVSNSFNCLVC